MSVEFFKRESRLAAQRNRKFMMALAGDACEACGFVTLRSGILNVHHIVPVEHMDGWIAMGRNPYSHGYPENLACLCPTCHALAHEAHRFFHWHHWGNLATRCSERQFKMLSALGHCLQRSEWAHHIATADFSGFRFRTEVRA